MLTPTTTTTLSTPSRPRLSLMMPLKPSSSPSSFLDNSTFSSPRRPRLTLSITSTPPPPTTSPTSILSPTHQPPPSSATSSPTSILSPTSTNFDVSGNKRVKVVKRVSFREEAEVKCVTPLPRECYGDRGSVMVARWRAEVGEGWE